MLLYIELLRSEAAELPWIGQEIIVGQSIIDREGDRTMVCSWKAFPHEVCVDAQEGGTFLFVKIVITAPGLKKPSPPPAAQSRTQYERAHASTHQKGDEKDRTAPRRRTT